MKARQYAEALYRAAHAHQGVDADALVSRLTTIVHERGHARLLPAIVREYDTIMRMRSTNDEVHVRVARESDHAKQTARITNDIASLNASGRTVRTVVDDTVIGGYSLETNGARVDRTYKQALLELYSSLITKA